MSTISAVMLFPLFIILLKMDECLNKVCTHSNIVTRNITISFEDKTMFNLCVKYKLTVTFTETMGRWPHSPLWIQFNENGSIMLQLLQRRTVSCLSDSSSVIKAALHRAKKIHLSPAPWLWFQYEIHPIIVTLSKTLLRLCAAAIMQWSHSAKQLRQ